MQTIVIDGRAFAIGFEGFDRPLQVATPGADQAGAVALRPWPCARHLASLRRHLRAAGPALALDGEGYAEDVLDWAGVPARLRPGLRPLALWWAHGIAPDEAGEAPPRAGEDGRVALAPGVHAHVRPWTWGERLAAQRAHLAGAHGALDFEPVGYLEHMLAASVVRLETEAGAAPEVGALDARATRRLLAAVTALNHPPAAADDPLADVAPALAAATLRLCAAMGWTPGRVLAMPAAEVERLLALLDRVEGVGPAGGLVPRPAPPPPRPPQSIAPAPRRPRLADHPDAVVILFGEDQGGGA